MLRIYLLGSIRLENDALSLPPFPTQKAASLFGYLVTHPARAHTREFLADLLWPDRPSDRARHSLHTALWHLRHLFKEAGLDPEHYLEISANRLSWRASSPAWLDVSQFEQACADGSLEKLQDAVSLHRGPFLVDLYEDWCLNERYRLEEMYLQALTSLAQLRYQNQEYTLALEYAFQLINADPLRETAYRISMQAYYQLDQRVNAIEQFQTCAQRLKRELNIEPSEETCEIYRAILEQSLPRLPSADWVAQSTQDQEQVYPELLLGRPHASSFETSQLPFIGRDAQINSLYDWWQARDEPLALISGEDGCGKSRLARIFAEHLQTRGVLIGWGRAYPLSQALPYNAVAEALRGLLSGTPPELIEGLPQWIIPGLSDLLPELHVPLLAPAMPRRSQINKAHLFDAVRQLLAILTRYTPVLLVVDDLNSAAESTWHIIEYLVQRRITCAGDSSHPIRFLATSGPQEMSPGDFRLMLHRLRKQDLLRDLPLGGLEQDRVVDWIEKWSRRGVAAAEFAAYLFQKTEGNPFFITQTVRALFESGGLKMGSQGWEGPAFNLEADCLPLPASVRELIYARLERLPPAADELLQVAAVRGHEFNLVVVQTACGHDEDQTLSAIDDLLRAHLIFESVDSGRSDYEFSHQMIRQAVYDRLSHTRRAALHRRVAQALETVYGPPTAPLFLHHYHQAGEFQQSVD